MDNKESLEVVNPPVFDTGNNKQDFSFSAPHFAFSPANRPHRLVFWKATSIGLGAAIAASAALALSGFSDYLMPAAIPFMVMSLLGAGSLTAYYLHLKLHLKSPKKHAIAPKSAPKAEQTAPAPNSQYSSIITVVYEGCDEYPSSDTFERDKVLASAKQALLSVDHTKITSH